MSKLLVAPRGLSRPELERKILKFRNFSVFESCTNVYDSSINGAMFLEDHLLLVVLNGFYNVKHNDQAYNLREEASPVLKGILPASLTCRRHNGFVKDVLQGPGNSLNQPV